MFKHFMNQTFTLKIIDGTDEYSQPNVAETKENLPCRIQWKNKLIISGNGQQKTSEGSVLTMQAAKVGDLITLEEKDYSIIAVSPMYDFDNVMQGYLLYF